MKHLIKFALFLLASVAACFVYAFTRQVAEWYVALPAAVSLVGTYVGLAYANIQEKQRAHANLVALGAMLVEAAYGFLYVLSIQSPAVFEKPLSLWISVPLALLHGSAFAVLAYSVSLFVVSERADAVQQPDPVYAALAALLDRLQALPVQPALTVQPAYDPPLRVDDPPVQAVQVPVQPVPTPVQPVRTDVQPVQVPVPTPVQAVRAATYACTACGKPPNKEQRAVLSRPDRNTWTCKHCGHTNRGE